MNLSAQNNSGEITISPAIIGINNDPSVYGSVRGKKYKIRREMYVRIYPETNIWTDVRSKYKSGKVIGIHDKTEFLDISDHTLTRIFNSVRNTIFSYPAPYPAQFYTKMDGSVMFINLAIDPQTGEVQDVEFEIPARDFDESIMPVSFFHEISEAIKKLKFTVTSAGRNLNYCYFSYEYPFIYNDTYYQHYVD